jgi:hypothetical protein
LRGGWPIWRIARGQLYPVLGRLEREGLMEGHLEPQGAGLSVGCTSPHPVGERVDIDEEGNVVGLFWAGKLALPL